MSKTPGPPPAAVRRRRNKDENAPVAQGTRRGVTILQPQPSAHWRTDVRNYFRSVLASGQADWYENSDLMTLTVQCELLDRILRQSRTEVVYQRDSNDELVIDPETGERVPVLDEWGEPQRRLVGFVNGQALKAALDMGQDLLVTEGARRRLRIDLGQPASDEDDPAKDLIAKQRAELALVKKA